MFAFAVLILTMTIGVGAAWTSFQQELKGKLILAPLTRGGNLAFRRLCADFGATHTMSEMAMARNLFKGYFKTQKKERALCRKAEQDHSKFGFQIATKSADEAIRASRFAKENGADWIDLNCGCPIWEATSRGLGVSLLKKPGALFKMVDLFARESELPVTVKIRIGTSDSKVNVMEVVQGLQLAGAQAVTVHGRSGEARYSKPADWDLLGGVSEKYSKEIPIIGNGDILTHFECEKRLAGVDGLMAGRGALIKPWIFQEFAEGRSLDPTPEQRVGIYFKLAQHFKDQFGDDDFGKRHAFYFLPWHFNFFCRYRAISKKDHDYLYSINAPPIQNSRALDDYLRTMDPSFDSDPLENLLRNDDPAVHMEISEMLWQSVDEGEAVASVRQLAESPTRVSMLIEAAKCAKEEGAEAASDERSWQAGGKGPRAAGDASGGDRRKPKQLHANNHEVLNDVDRCLFHLEMRSGKVLEVQDHPHADNLQINVVDLGTERGGAVHVITGRKGLDRNYLLGLSVVCLCNIQKAELQGKVSEAMVLFSYEESSDTYSPLLVPKDTVPGTQVTFREEQQRVDTDGSPSGGGSSSSSLSQMDRLLLRESKKAGANFHGVSKGRLHKSMKKALRCCYAQSGGHVVYKTAGSRKNFELVVGLGGDDVVPRGRVVSEGEGRVC